MTDAQFQQIVDRLERIESLLTPVVAKARLAPVDTTEARRFVHFWVRRQCARIPKNVSAYGMSATFVRINGVDANPESESAWRRVAQGWSGKVTGPRVAAWIDEVFAHNKEAT